MKNRATAPNLASVDKCFACQAAAEKAAGGKVSAGKAVPVNARAGLCSRCFEAYNVPKESRDACVAGVTNPSASAVAAAGVPACYNGGVGDKTKCLECVKKAKTAEDAAGCGSCSTTNNVPSRWV